MIVLSPLMAGGMDTAKAGSNRIRVRR